MLLVVMLHEQKQCHNDCVAYIDLTSGRFVDIDENGLTKKIRKILFIIFREPLM